NRSVPRDLDTICLKCLEPEPARRYSTGQQLADDLGRYLRGETIQARHVTRPERVWRWSRRNPVTALLSFAFGLVLMAAVIILAVSRARIAQSNAAQRTQLARLKVTEGWRLVEDGDLFGALAPFSEALLLEKDDPKRQEMH